MSFYSVPNIRHGGWLPTHATSTKICCRMLPTRFPIFPYSPDTILNLEPRIRTYYPTFYSFIIFSEYSTSRLKTTRKCRKLRKTSLVAGTTRRRDRQRWALRHQCIKSRLRFSFSLQVMFCCIVPFRKVKCFVV